MNKRDITPYTHVHQKLKWAFAKLFVPCFYSCEESSLLDKYKSSVSGYKLFRLNYFAIFVGTEMGDSKRA